MRKLTLFLLITISFVNIPLYADYVFDGNKFTVYKFTGILQEKIGNSGADYYLTNCKKTNRLEPGDRVYYDINNTNYDSPFNNLYDSNSPDNDFTKNTSCKTTVSYVITSIKRASKEEHDSYNSNDLCLFSFDVYCDY